MPNAGHTHRPFLSRALIGSSHNSTDVLQGIRTLCNMSIVAVHAHFIGSIMLDDVTPSMIDPSATFFIRYIFIFIMAMGNASIDIFLFLSGFLLTQRIITTSKYNLPLSRALVVQYILLRWLRLIPLYLSLAMLWRYFAVDGCIRVSEILFIRNFFVDCSKPVAQQFCVGHGWFIPVEFQSQLFILSLFSVSRSWHAVRYRIMFFIAFLCAFRAYMWIHAGKPVSEISSLVDVIEDYNYLRHIGDSLGIQVGNVHPNDVGSRTRRDSFIPSQRFYFLTIFRIPPALVGSFIAITLFHQQYNHIVKMVRKFPLCVLIICLSTILFFVKGFSVPYIEDNAQVRKMIYNSDEYLIFEALGRTLLAIGIGFLTIVICREENNGNVDWITAMTRKVLGNKILVGLSRSSYAVYLTHTNFIGSLSLIWPRLSKQNYTIPMVLFSVFKFYLIAVLGSIPFCIIEEFFLELRRITQLRLQLKHYSNKSN